MDRVEADKQKTRARNRLKRQRREGMLLGFLAGAAILLMVVAVRMKASALLSMAAIFVSFAVLALTVFLAVDLWGRREADLDMVRGGLDRDQVQSAEALTLVVMSALGLLYMTFGIEAAWRISSQSGGFDDWKSVLFSLVMPTVVMKVILSGKMLRRNAGALERDADELTIHFRRSALTWSIILTFTAMAAVFVAGLLDAPLAVAGMPAVFEIAALTAALRYWWLDRQASRG